MTPKFQFVANGLYEAPFGINVAANLLIRQGYGQPYYQEIEAPARDPYALKDVLLVPDVGDNRLQAIESFDLRVGKAFRVNGITMNVDLDWFNVLNAATVLGRQYDPGTADGPEAEPEPDPQKAGIHDFQPPVASVVGIKFRGLDIFEGSHILSHQADLLGDLPPGTSPLSKLDLGPFEVHSMV